MCRYAAIEFLRADTMAGSMDFARPETGTLREPVFTLAA
jgi:hypothetical protein